MHIGNRRFVGWALSALLVAMMMTASGSAATAALQPGDEAVVSHDGTPLKIGHETLATLARGQRLKVLKVEGPWVGVSIDGQDQRGWVWSERAMTPQQFAAQPRRVRRYSFDPSTQLSRPRASYSRGGSSSSSSRGFIMGATPYGPSYWRADRKIMGY